MTAAHFEAKKHAYRQTQDGIVISFVVHPNDVAAALATAPLGTRYMVAFAEIGDDEKPKESPTDKPASSQGAPAGVGRRKFGDLPFSQRAALRCADPAFQKWMGHSNEADTAEDVRQSCGIKSRAELDTNDQAATVWCQIDSSYMEATGRIAEQRG